MEGKEITLEQMLIFREKRADMQKKLLHDNKSAVISFSMNIPGPIKTNQEVRRAFDAGKNELLQKLKQAGMQCGSAIEIHEACGDEYIAAIHADPQAVKDITTHIEDMHPYGRLYDIDVIDQDENKLSRETYRKCLICERQAQECARVRRHSVEDMQKAVEKILHKTGTQTR